MAKANIESRTGQGYLTPSAKDNSTNTSLQFDRASMLHHENGLVMRVKDNLRSLPQSEAAAGVVRVALYAGLPIAVATLYLSSFLSDNDRNLSKVPVASRESQGISITGSPIESVVRVEIPSKEEYWTPTHYYNGKISISLDNKVDFREGASLQASNMIPDNSYVVKVKDKELKNAKELELDHALILRNDDGWWIMITNTETFEGITDGNKRDYRARVLYVHIEDKYTQGENALIKADSGSVVPIQTTPNGERILPYGVNSFNEVAVR